MAQTMVNIRMDVDLKRDVEKVCSEMGLSTSFWTHKANGLVKFSSLYLVIRSI